MTRIKSFVVFGPLEEDKRVLTEEKAVLVSEKTVLQEEKISLHVQMNVAVKRAEDAEAAMAKMRDEREDPFAKVGYCSGASLSIWLVIIIPSGSRWQALARSADCKRRSDGVHGSPPAGESLHGGAAQVGQAASGGIGIIKFPDP